MDEKYIERFYKKLGARFKEIRLSKGFTQEQMAEHGFSTRFYQRIEAGKIIHLKTVLKLAKALKTSIGDLFKGL